MAKLDNLSKSPILGPSGQDMDKNSLGRKPINLENTF
jgi:hypothetical protein